MISFGAGSVMLAWAMAVVRLTASIGRPGSRGAGVSITAQFVRIAQVGVAGFVIDSACWRSWPFLPLRGDDHRGRSIDFGDSRAAIKRFRVAEWAKFLSANSVEGAINYCASVILPLRLRTSSYLPSPLGLFRAVCRLWTDETIRVLVSYGADSNSVSSL